MMTPIKTSAPRRSRFPLIPSKVRHQLWKWRVRSGLYLRVVWWRLKYGSVLHRTRRLATTTHPWISALQNALPNSGGFPIQGTPEEVVSSMRDRRTRGSGVAEFEGLALDDALVFTDDYKHLSYIPLACALVGVGRRFLGRDKFSVLELGCGGGSFGAFLAGLGIDRYLGVDVNTVAFQHSPWIRARQGSFRLLNLQEDIDFGGRFDLVCTFEVLEHIREDRLEHILGTIRRHLDSDGMFVGTASLQQDGDVHVTVKEKAYWLERFGAHGLVEHPQHRAIEELLGRHHPFNWWPANTNVFALVHDTR
jgi:2-polyprenyl-3-methyl-5-hydroxy-6-metoxy-1,4-benzoquinol methylase